MTLGLALALAACQVRVAPPVDLGGTPGPSAKRSTRPAGPGEPAGTPSPAATAGAAPSPGAEARAVVPTALLRRPAAPAQVLRGAVRIDASYALVAGKLVSNNGGMVLAVGEVGLLANNGGNLIANKGSGLISDKGAGLISDKGSGLTSKTKLALLQSPPAVGQVLPAAGMRVRATSLKDGAAIPLGVDEAGAPVYAIHSDAAGAYEVYLPVELAGNVLITAEVPDTTDERLVYDVLVPARSERPSSIDEDSAVFSYLTRRAYVNVLVEIFTAKDINGVVTQFEAYGAVPQAARELLVTIARDFRAEADKVGIAQASPAQVEALAQRIADGFTRHLALGELTIGQESVPPFGTRRADAERLIGKNAVAIEMAVLEAIRKRAAELMAKDPDFFDKQGWIVRPNEARAAAGRPPITIERPSDVGQFLVEAYMNGTNANLYDNIDEVMRTIDLEVDPNTGVRVSNVFNTANNSIGLAISQVMLGNIDGAKDEAIATIAAFRPGKAP